MATYDNPFPEKVNNKSKTKSSIYYAGMVGGGKGIESALYFEETINTSVLRNEEMSFNDQDNASSSIRSGLSQSTFRDT